MKNLILILFTLYFLPLSGQTLVDIYGDKYEVLGPAEGLASSNARTMLVDSRGRLWIGTDDGISVYDGYEFTTYKDFDTEDSNFQGKIVNHIVEAIDGNIIVATEENGIQKYDPLTDSFYTLVAQDKLEGPTRKLLITSSGDLIIGLDTRMGLLSSDEIRFTPLKDSLISLDKYEDRLIMTSKSAITEVSNDLKIKELIKVDAIKSIHWSKDWVLVLTHKTLIKYSHSFDPLDSLVFDINFQKGLLTMNEGVVFISDDTYLTRLNATDFSDQTRIEWPSYIRILDYESDLNGNLFIGTVQGFLKYASKSRLVKNIDLTQEFGGTIYVRTSAEVGNEIWFASDYGLIIYNRETESKEHITSIPGDPFSLPGNSIQDIQLDRTGKIWVSTDQGLCYYESSTHRFIRITDNWAGIIKVSEDNRLVFNGGEFGLRLLDTETLKISNITDKTTFQYEIHGSSLWVLKYPSELNHYEFSPGAIQWIESFQLKRNYGSMNVDNQGKVWIIYPESGLSIFDPDSAKITARIYRDDSFQGNYTTGQFMNRENNEFWVQQAEFGLVRIDIEDMSLERIKHPQLKSSWPRYDMPKYRLKDGSYVTDGFNSVKIFTSELMEKEGSPPNVYLESMSIGDSSIVYNNLTRDQGISLSHSQNTLSFAFVGLHLFDPLQNVYEYTLENHDPSWINSGTNRRAQYSNLSPGDYTFKVRSASTDRIWSEPVALVTLTIDPPWYQTIIAYLSYAVLLVFITVMVVRYRINRRLELAERDRLRQMDEFKNRFFMNITHEFRTPITILLGMARRIGNDEGKLIEKNGEQLLTMVNQILELGKID